jgi:glucose-6-phosphate isomerase
MSELMTKPVRECLESLIALRAPSRLGQKDASLYNQIPGAAEYAANFLGWASLSSKPPMPIAEIAEIAAGIRQEGLDAVVLIGQGGSSQAAMTITKLHEVATGRRDSMAGGLDFEFKRHQDGGIRPDVCFRTMDSLSPVFVNHILGSSDPARTLYIVSSKSGSTIEPLMLERVTWRYVAGHLGIAGAAKRFVAITDPGSKLQQLAEEKGYRLVINSPVDVGGRFSALSVFSMFPAALVGIDIESAILHTATVEYACSRDNEDNPALQLAAFIYANYNAGRDKISLVMPPSGQVFGLWIEQLLAESLGKQGKGILPNVEVDPSVLAGKHRDRCIIVYEVGARDGFAEAISNFHPNTPCIRFSLDTVAELFGRFVVWEYAVAFLGILMSVNPFNQPDVEDTKMRVRTLLQEQLESAAPKDEDAKVKNNSQTENYQHIDYPASEPVRSIRLSDSLLAAAELNISDIQSVDHALRVILGSLTQDDYFSINAFLPFRGYGRREALERMRNRVVSRLGNAACLEIGPRYLHSTGQLHKGGPNNGVFLFICAEEENDIIVPNEAYTLGDLAITQTKGDFEALASRDRRVMLVQLRDNDSETLSQFADRVCLAISAIM